MFELGDHMDSIVYCDFLPLKNAVRLVFFFFSKHSTFKSKLTMRS